MTRNTNNSHLESFGVKDLLSGEREKPDKPFSISNAVFVQKGEVPIRYVAQVFEARTDEQDITR